MAFNPAMSRKLVLRDRVDASSVRAVAEESGWAYVGQIKADPESGTCYEVKWETGNGTAVHYIVDDFVGMAYLVAMNENREAAEDVIDHAAEALPCWSVAEMLIEAGTHVYPADWAAALLRLGVGAPSQPMESVLSMIRAGARHRDAEVRIAAAWSMAYAEWPDFLESLDDLAQADEDPAVSEAAASTLAEFRAAGGEQRRPE